MFRTPTARSIATRPATPPHASRRLRQRRIAACIGRIVSTATLTAIAFLMACADPTAPGRQHAAPHKPTWAAVEAAAASRYLVVLKTALPQPANVITADLLTRHGLTPYLVFEDNAPVKGFSAFMSDAQARALATHPLVSFIERVQVGRGLADQVQLSPASWGLDRIDTRPRTYDNRYVYSHPPRVNVYVFDSGISEQHSDFYGKPGTSSAS